MKEPYYTIKEASAKVGVESHVLRYWEEELKMDIHRNQMGHRYYTEHDIDLLCMVHKLKDKGLQLKAIRGYIDKRREQIDNENRNINYVPEDKQASYLNDTDAKESNPSENGEKKELVPVKTGRGIMSNAEKLEQFQRIMNRILSNAIQENNELIGRSAGEHAASAVVTQIQGMTKEQEEKAEERYRKLDQTLREIQLARKEAAAAGIRPVDRRRQQRLKRKNKNKDKEEDADTISNAVQETESLSEKMATENMDDKHIGPEASDCDVEKSETVMGNNTTADE